MRRLWILLSLFLITHGAPTEGTDVKEYEDENVHSPGADDYDENEDDISQFNRMERDIVVRKRNDSNSALHAALSDKSKRWKNGIVPYRQGYRISAHSFRAQMLKEAMDEIGRRTCVKFVQNDDNLPDYVFFKAPPGRQCSSEIGRQGGRQYVTLTDDCFTRATIQHELLHVLGFVHEQNRPDRDEWIEIKWENIKDGEGDQPDIYKKNFDKRSYEAVDLAKTGYSYESIMHYGKNDFSKDENHLPTIVAKKPGGNKIGNRDYLAEIDVLRINIIYECKSHLQTTPMTKILPSAPSTGQPPLETTRPPTSKPETSWKVIYTLDIGDFEAEEITFYNNDDTISVEGEQKGNNHRKSFSASFTTPVVYSDVKADLEDGKLIFKTPDNDNQGRWKIIHTLDIGDYSEKEITFSTSGNTTSIKGEQKGKGYQKSFSASFITPMVYSEVEADLEDRKLIFKTPDNANQVTKPPTPPAAKSKSRWRVVYSLNIPSGYRTSGITKELKGKNISFRGDKNENGNRRFFTNQFTTPVAYSEIRHFVEGTKLIFLAPENEVADKNSQVYTYD